MKPSGATKKPKAPRRVGRMASVLLLGITLRSIHGVLDLSNGASSLWQTPDVHVNETVLSSLDVTRSTKAGTNQSLLATVNMSAILENAVTNDRTSEVHETVTSTTARTTVTAAIRSNETEEPPAPKQARTKEPRLNLPLKVGLPIHVTSLPKSGTTSIWKFFLCGGQHTTHTYVKINDTLAMRGGDCVERNVRAHRPPFDNCGPYDVWTDSGHVATENGQSRCFYPSVDALDEIYQAYPTSTIFMLTRNASSWYESIRKHHRGSLLKRWIECGMDQRFPQLGPAVQSAEWFIQFYNAHTEHVREFAKAHPTMTYIELELEDLDLNGKLESAFGVPKSCWIRCPPNQQRRCNPRPF